MSAVIGFGHWIIGGAWWTRRPEGSQLTWGRLVVASIFATALVTAVFTGLATGGFVGGVALALLWVPAQAAVIVGLVYSAWAQRRIS